MKLTVITEDDQFKEIELDSEARVQDVKEVLQIEFGIPLQQQELFSNNKIMNDQKLIKEYCNDNDMIRLAIKIPANPLFGNNNNGGNNQMMLNNAQNIANALGNLLGGSMQTNIQQKYLQQAREFKAQIRSAPYILDNMKHQNPTLANLIQNGTEDELANFLKKNDEEKIKKRMKEQQELDELEKDPFNVDNQRKIEEIINQRQIDENLEMAQEYIPEVFGKISMLYIDCVINNHAIQAFVDTGAESTIMSKACAERCGLMRLVDKRFSGMASGVGTGKILGRIHKYSIQILDQRFECSFTVLESINLDFLLGLDNMKRFQCCVNLRDNTLNFTLGGDKELKVPFLHEKDIKKTVCIEQEQKLFDEENHKEKSSNTDQNKPAQQQQSSSQPQQTQQSQYKESDIDTLINMFGVTRNQAIESLRATQGNVELAGSILAMRKF